MVRGALWMRRVSLTLQLAANLAGQPLVVLVAIVLPVHHRIRPLALPLALARLRVSEALMPILRACRAEGPLAIASGLALSTGSTSGAQKSVSVRNVTSLSTDMLLMWSRAAGRNGCKA
jgi:hypothetical protein